MDTLTEPTPHEARMIERLDAVVEFLAANRIPVEKALWDQTMIARYLSCSRTQVARYLALPDFPDAIRLPTVDGHRSHPRWKAREVMAWVDHQARRSARGTRTRRGP